MSTLYEYQNLMIDVSMLYVNTVWISKSNDRCKYVVCQHYEYQNLMIDVSMLYVNTVRISKSNDRCKYVVCQHCTNIKI